MNPVLPKTTRFGGFYDALYKPGRAVFNAPERVSNAVTRLTSSESPNILQKFLFDPIVKTVGWFTKNAVTYDYNKMIPVGKLHVAQAPIGALMMMFLPFTILPRMFQALKRGHGSKDEFWDILRRDIPTIGILLFALDPMVRKLNIIKSKMDGMTIVETAEQQTAKGAKKAFGEVFSYSKLAQIFNIDRPETLYEIAKQGNAKGMEKALGTISKQWLKNPYLGKAKQHEIETFKNSVSGMLAELAKGGEADETLARSLSAKAFDALSKLDVFRASRFGSLTERDLPKLADFMVRHARTRRLPIDILSFALVAVGIGWLPVWFNDLWSRKEYAEKQAGGQSTQSPSPLLQGMPAAGNFDPAATFRAFQQSSPLARQYATSTNPFGG